MIPGDLDQNDSRLKQINDLASKPSEANESAFESNQQFFSQGSAFKSQYNSIDVVDAIRIEELKSLSKKRGKRIKCICFDLIF